MPVKVSWNKHVDGAAPPKMIMSTMTMKPMPAGIVCPTRTGPPVLDKHVPFVQDTQRHVHTAGPAGIQTCGLEMARAFGEILHSLLNT